jgi:hypothetical protein
MEDGWQVYTFAMLTVNADGHPVMQRFHKAGDEKRMVVILHPDDYDDWLTCSVEQAPRYFRQWMEPLDAVAAPLPPRAPKTISGKVVAPPAPPEDPGLFSAPPSSSFASPPRLAPVYSSGFSGSGCGSPA